MKKPDKPQNIQINKRLWNFLFSVLSIADIFLAVLFSIVIIDLHIAVLQPPLQLNPNKNYKVQIIKTRAT